MHTKSQPHKEPLCPLRPPTLAPKAAGTEGGGVSELEDRALPLALKVSIRLCWEGGEGGGGRAGGL